MIVPKWLQFSLGLDLTGIKMLSVALFPGLLVSVCSGNLLWLMVSFITVCSILPYTVGNNSRGLVFVHVFLIAVIIYLVEFALRVNIYYLLIILPILALAAGCIDNSNKTLRSFASWLIIGGVYGGVKLRHYNFSQQEFVYFVILTLISLCAVVFIFSREVVPIKVKLIKPFDPKFIFNFKYVLPITIAVLIWIKFNLQEPQWIFWSSLSVVYPELENAIVKVKQRVSGALLGAGFGLFIGLLIPNSIVITYICFIMIMFSLRMFKDYFPGFVLRCFFVVLYAGSLSTEIAFIRISNVILGGIIGISCTFLLAKIYQSRKNS